MKGGGGEPLHPFPTLYPLCWAFLTESYQSLNSMNWMWEIVYGLTNIFWWNIYQENAIRVLFTSILQVVKPWLLLGFQHKNVKKTNLAWSCGHLEAKHISYLDCLMFSFPSRTYCTCNNYLTGLFATLNWLPWNTSLHCNPTFHPLEEQVTKSFPIYSLLSIQIDTQQFATFFPAIPINLFTVHSR